MKPLRIFVLFLCVILSGYVLTSCDAKENTQTGKNKRPVVRDGDSIRMEMEQVLKKEFSAWYPLSIDHEYGGYFSDMNYEWELDGRQDKMIVTQARHVWSASNAFINYNNDTAMLSIASHGVEFLKSAMWDNEFGGFYDLVNRKGKPNSERGEIIKRAYGNSFAIYALAAYYKAAGDESALKLAQETFRWIEKNSYDKQYGGYFQFMSRDGSPFMEGYNGTPPKDYNSLIHILECFTELYSVWPDPVLKERLQSLLVIIRDNVTDEKGFLKLYFNREWIHVVAENNFAVDHISFGHDVETAYLMLEASEVLGLKNDTATLRVAKRMVDHALANGWDNENGGLYDGGYYYKGNDRITITRNTKEWWSQVEAFNAFLLMAKLFPDEPRYYEKFCIQWNYCMNYLIDHERGGWYWAGTDIEPDNIHSPKSSIWKCSYHTSRSMINSIKRLRENNAHTGK